MTVDVVTGSPHHSMTLDDPPEVARNLFPFTPTREGRSDGCVLIFYAAFTGLNLALFVILVPNSSRAESQRIFFRRGRPGNTGCFKVSMDVGLNVRDYIDDPTRPMHEQLDEAAEIFRQARGMGFTTIYMPQHFIAHPTRWPQPMEILSRLAPDAEGMRLMTGIMLLTYHNPVDIAEQVATLDQISNGRFTLGVGLGYVEKELEAFGTNRAERVSRLEESIALIKELWTGEEVNHEGQHWTVRGGRMGMTPVQEPHPPIWLAAQSRGAVRRAARIADACLMGPQPKWEDIDNLAAMYWEAIAEQPGKTGHLTASRSMSVARDRETAVSQAIAAGEAKAGLYTNFNMQESTTVDLGLGGSRDLDQWAIVGNPQDCAETIMRCHEANDLDHIGLGALNLPNGKTARLEYLQLISEELLPLLK